MESSLEMKKSELSDSLHQAVIESASNVVKKIFEASNNKHYLKGLDYYSDDKNAFFVSNGKIQSLDELRSSYVIAGKGVEDLHNEILAWNSRVLSENLVSFTLPVKLRLKLKGIPEYTGQINWSALVQKIDGKWLVVQSHESWVNSAEVAKALSA